MALEFRDHLEATLEIRLSVATVWSYPTVLKLVTHLTDRFNTLLSDVAKVDATPPPPQAGIEAEIERLSDDELLARLDEKLAKIDIVRGRKS
jgi:hypothetical protein